MIVRALAFFAVLNLSPSCERLRSTAPVTDTLSQYSDAMPDEPKVEEEYKRPPGISLLFCPLEQILAAPKEEREAYYRIVDDLLTHPEDYGFRHETSADLAADDAVDRALAAMNQDWS